MICPRCKKALTKSSTWEADKIVYCLNCGEEVKDSNNKKSDDLMDRGQGISMEDLDGFEVYDPTTKTISKVYAEKKE